MEMFYLVFSIYSYSAVTIPVPYTKEACEEAGKSLSAVWYRCVQAPKEDYCKWHYQTFPPGLTAGNMYATTKKVCD